MTTVLVVEDDPDVREGLVAILEMEGFGPAAALHGRDALDQCRPGLRPDAILLDLMMPVMSGEEFLVARADEPEIARIPVVVLTAGGTDRIDREGWNVRQVLRKPADPDRMIAEIRRAGGAQAPVSGRPSRRPAGALRRGRAPSACSCARSASRSS